MDEFERSRRAFRLSMLGIGIVVGGILLVLGTASWNIASEPAHETTGLVAQMQLLLAVVQGFLGLAIGLSTIFYAGRTGEMVTAMQRAESRAVADARRGAVDRFLEAALEVVVHAPSLARLRRWSWRYILPGGRRTHEMLTHRAYGTLTTGIASALKAADSLKATSPEEMDLIDRVLSVIEMAFEASTAGRLDDASAAALELRTTARDLRASTATRSAAGSRGHGTK